MFSTKLVAVHASQLNPVFKNWSSFRFNLLEKIKYLTTAHPELYPYINDYLKTFDPQGTRMEYYDPTPSQVEYSYLVNLCEIWDGGLYEEKSFQRFLAKMAPEKTLPPFSFMAFVLPLFKKTKDAAAELSATYLLPVKQNKNYIFFNHLKNHNAATTMLGSVLKTHNHYPLHQKSFFEEQISEIEKNISNEKLKKLFQDASQAQITFLASAPDKRQQVLKDISIKDKALLLKIQIVFRLAKIIYGDQGPEKVTQMAMAYFYQFVTLFNPEAFERLHIPFVPYSVQKTAETLFYQTTPQAQLVRYAARDHWLSADDTYREEWVRLIQEEFRVGKSFRVEIELYLFPVMYYFCELLEKQINNR